MSARRISDKAIEMPNNPYFFDFERSDGNPSRWPPNTTRIVDSSGEVNYMQPLTLEHPQSMRWRLGVAQGIAAATGMPASPSYILRNWPTGYAFFDHHKGPADNPRHDLYLYGSVNRRYRSINEFIPHAIWLYQTLTTDTSKCLCKYCQKMPQKEVTASHAPGIMRVSHNTPSSSRSRPGRPKTMEVAAKHAHDKVYASVQRAPIPVISKSPNVHSKTTMLVERNSDLRAMSSKTSMKLRRWFRTGELLWCALSHPIKGPNGTAIDFWPGLVDEVKLKTRPVPRETLGEMRAPLDRGKAPDAAAHDTSDAVPWGISQSTEYRMQLLAVNHTYLVFDDQVLPYQAHVPSDDLITALKAFPTERLNFDRGSMSRFNPCPKEGGAHFDDAVAPYAMAVQIGSTLSGYWCLTDEWAFEYHLSQDVFPTPTPPRPKSAPSLATSLSAAIEAAGQHNAQANDSISSGLSSYSGPTKPHPNGNSYPNVSGANPHMSSSETQRLSARVLGKITTPPGANSPPLTQMRFQGLWWGAERIWTDEFVRLKVPRRCIAPLGAENILPPSGPGKSTLAMWEASGKNIQELGAGSRGVFMRLDGLFVVDAVQGDGYSTKKECRASGMLYELADIDWVEESTRMSDSSSKENMVPMTFVPAPSPLNPHIPRHPNSEPNIPVTIRPQQSTPNLLPPTAQQSHPLRSHYTLPEAPTGYFFRPILPEGYEAVVSLSFISGRYYPRILSHPLLEKYVEMAMTNSSGLLEHNNLWALEGLSAGFHNSVDPIHYRSSRMKMVEDADVTSVRELEIHKQQRMREREEENMEDVDELAYPDAMDVAAAHRAVHNCRGTVGVVPELAALYPALVTFSASGSDFGGSSQE
ncbi:hypothetical protein C0995_009528 [Termitomyces sp. Mi166|nr:hypothetical protein C0995_009528 [Termitomyces sp. Mi166\